MSNLTAAVIGCGRMGAFTSPSVREYGPDCFLPSAHAEAFQQAEGIDLVAVCDANAEGAARAAEHYGVARNYIDHGAMLADGAPDLIGIATRTIGRTDMIADCIDAGTRALHVEKPICNSFAELERLETLFARDDVFVTLGAVRRHFAIYKEAVARAQSGNYGELLEANAEFGARTLYWSHPHTVDLILLAAAGAKVEAVQARLGEVERKGLRIVNDPVVMDATIWFEGGFAGRITRVPGTDFRMACQTAQIAVIGNGHSLWLSGRPKPDPDAPRDANPAGANPYHEPEKQKFVAPDEPQGALAPILQLADCLKGSETARNANAALKRDITTGQRILFAIVQSHFEGGRPVTLDEIDPDLFIEGRTGDTPA
ncbi:MAG: Gfo/Idh/MocA family oxidoreductase [Erythrobacter sp.]|nr:Gfo/Idh/MocA family oxidoreductase [Erythrobacter sp.]